MKGADFFVDGPPPGLVEALNWGRCLLFAGSSLSQAAGYPSWSQSARDLLQFGNDIGILDPPYADSLFKSVEMGEIDYVLDTIANQLENRERQEDLAKFLQRGYIDPQYPPTDLHALLGTLPFMAAITPNYDDLLERTFANRPKAKPYHIFASRHAAVDDFPYFEAMQRALEKGAFFFLKLRGWLEQPATVILSAIQYRDFLDVYSFYSEFLANLFHSHVIFFCGCALDEILRCVEPLRISGAQQEHYALVSPAEPAWESKADRLMRRYGIRSMVPAALDPASADLSDDLHRCYLSFLNEMAAQARIQPGAPVIKEPPTAATWLKRISLQNIGPFQDFEIELDRHWNILLGDNGVGKSNIIRAIATCLLGRNALPYFNRVIRFGRNNASITLETNEGKQYGLNLFRKGANMNFSEQGGSLLDLERWLVLGFPPARTVTWNAVKVQLDRVLDRTNPDDLLPLLSGEADPRLDSVKQWFVNIDYQIKSRSGHDYQALRQRMIDIIKRVTGGLNVEYEHVDEKSGTVYFNTDDGIVPVDAVSQGTASLIGWVGCLTQRIFEVFPDQDPQDVHALVLVDEIDAHMHPLWQQSLVENLNSLFPNIQFIATTHSPLITISSKPDEVIRLRRDEPNRTSIIVERSELDVRRWRADQVLTSSLFGLDSSNSTTFKWLKEYTELLAKETLDEKEEGRVKYLASMLEIPPPEPFEREEARVAFRGLEKALDEQIADIPDEKKEQIRREAKVQLLESITRVRRPQ